MKQIELKINHLNRVNPESALKMYHGQPIPYISQYLTSLGIAEDDIPSFIDKPRDEDEDKPFDLDNMQEAIDCAAKMLVEPNAVAYVQVDSDTDGYTSASILINYLHIRYPNLPVHYGLHPGKEHGVDLSQVPAETTVVFIPDAGSNQFDEQEELVNSGKKVIVLDHHEVTNFRDTGAIIVNNQLSPKFSNKFMSGAGVVYMFIQAMDKTYFADQTPIYQNYRDLAAIGIIADAMNMTTLGNNFLAYYGLNYIKNPFVKELAIKQARGIKDPEHLTKIDVAFYLAPVINGVIRSGAPEDKEAVFHAMVTAEDSTDYTREWRGVTYHENLWERSVRLAMNAKGRQDAAKKKSFEWLCGKIRANGWDKDNIIIATLDKKESAKVSPNITGLIAMELVKEFNRPTLVLRETEFDGQEMFGGSGRNGNFYGLPDFKAKLAAAGGYYQEGHANAFGSFLLPNQVQSIRDYFNLDIDSGTFDDQFYEVDYWFENGEPLDQQMLFELASYDALWGNSIPQPKIAADVNYDSQNIMVMGKNKDSVKMRIQDIDFVAFKNPELIEELAKHPGGSATIIGRPQLNMWQGRASIQMVIDDIDIHDSVNVNDLIDDIDNNVSIMDLI